MGSSPITRIPAANLVISFAALMDRNYTYSCMRKNLTDMFSKVSPIELV